MVVTKNMAKYIKDKGINLAAMSRATGIAYNALYASLGSKTRERPLSADEAVLACKFLGMKVEDFADEPNTYLPEDKGKEVG